MTIDGKKIPKIDKPDGGSGSGDAGSSEQTARKPDAEHQASLLGIAGIATGLGEYLTAGANGLLKAALKEMADAVGIKYVKPITDDFSDKDKSQKQEVVEAAPAPRVSTGEEILAAIENFTKALKERVFAIAMVSDTATGQDIVNNASVGASVALKETLVNRAEALAAGTLNGAAGTFHNLVNQAEFSGIATAMVDYGSGKFTPLAENNLNPGNAQGNATQSADKCPEIVT